MSLSYVHGTGTVPLLGETIGALLDRIAAEFGDRVALISHHQNLRYTYAQLLEQVNRAARALLALGVQRGDRVGIWSGNVAEWVQDEQAAAVLAGWGCDYLQGDLVGRASLERPWAASAAAPESAAH